MDRHPIENIMTTTMENIRDMVDVNTVIGDPVNTPDGATVIPVSRVSFGFVAGGGEYSAGEAQPPTAAPANTLPFAGGSGAGVSVQPVGFLVVGDGSVKMLPAQSSGPLDRVVELLPQLLCDLSGKDQQKQPATLKVDVVEVNRKEDVQ